MWVLCILEKISRFAALRLETSLSSSFNSCADTLSKRFIRFWLKSRLNCTEKSGSRKKFMYLKFAIIVVSKFNGMSLF